MNGLIDDTKELEQESLATQASSGVKSEYAAKEADGITGTAEPPVPASGYLPELEYVEVREEYRPSPRRQLPRRRKRRRAVLVILWAVAALGLAAFSLGLLDVPQALRMENVTETPEGAVVPVFVPIDPTEFISPAADELIIVPDETGLELPPDSEAPAAASPTPQNYYVQTPNVSEFHARAAQDESYVYFMQHVASEDKYALSDLMRARISSGKAEPVQNANEISGSIYSFALLGQNIITCEYNSGTQAYAFYRVPKSSEDAQFLFEEDSPALMNVYDNKLFLFFASAQKLGVFDISSDAKPSFIDMALTDESSRYFPEFSVINGYLYYGVSYGDGDSVLTEYMRRSLYTGETTVLLASSEDDGIRILNPYWDEAGNAYYWMLDSGAGTYSLACGKNGTAPEILNAFDFDSVLTPALALKDEFLVASASSDRLCKYNRESDFSVEFDSQAQKLPYAATKDFLIAPDGLYRIFDLSFTGFSG